MVSMKYVLTPEIKDLGICCAVVAEVHGCAIAPTNPNLENLKKKAATGILRIDEEDLLRNPILQSYRELVQSVGRSLRKFPPAAEELIRSVKRTGSFPTINAAVDSYNLVAAKTFLAFGVHDIAKLGDRITFRVSRGNEPFTSVGSTKTKHTSAGDYVYADDNRVLAWLDSKDSDDVKLSTESQNITIVIQGTPATSAEYRLSAIREACDMITEYCGGRYETLVVE